jgi:hypothetical protein
MKTPIYPIWICDPCGREHGYRDPRIATWHINTCDICGTKGVLVTEPRDFGHLRSSWMVAYNNKIELMKIEKKARKFLKDNGGKPL